jgi:hypothetical protein
MNMAEYGEWNRKGAVLSDVTAQKAYGVTRDFIVKGIQSGKLEYREGSVWGNPYLRILRNKGAARLRILGEAKGPDGIGQHQQGDCQSQEEAGSA